MAAQADTKATRTIRRSISRVYRYIGDRDADVSEPDVYEFVMDSRAQLAADLILSETFRPVVTAKLTNVKRETILGSVENFAFEIGVDYRRAGQKKWETLDIVAPERVADAEMRGDHAASFYNTPRTLLLSFDPSGFEFQLRYVSTQVPADTADALESSDSFPEVFTLYADLLAAHKAMPHTSHDDRTYGRLMDVVKEEIALTEPKYRRLVEKPLKREASRRPKMSDAWRGRRRGSRLSGRPLYTEG